MGRRGVDLSHAVRYRLRHCHGEDGGAGTAKRSPEGTLTAGCGLCEGWRRTPRKDERRRSLFSGLYAAQKHEEAEGRGAPVSASCVEVRSFAGLPNALVVR